MPHFEEIKIKFIFIRVKKIINFFLKGLDARKLTALETLTVTIVEYVYQQRLRIVATVKQAGLV